MATYGKNENNKVDRQAYTDIMNCITLYINNNAQYTDLVFAPLEVTMIQDSNVKSFAILGLLESQKDYKVIRKTAMIVSIDIRNDTYLVEPLEGEVTNIQEVKLTQPKTQILANGSNHYAGPYANYETAVKDYANLYKMLAIRKPRNNV